MTTMMELSLWLNVAVLFPVSVLLIGNRAAAAAVFGEPTPARGILRSIYLAILVVSVSLLFLRDPRAVAAVLVLQVVYKFTTPWTVGSLRNPVVRSNLAIAGFHLTTLVASREVLHG